MNLKLLFLIIVYYTAAVFSHQMNGKMCILNLIQTLLLFNFIPESGLWYYVPSRAKMLKSESILRAMALHRRKLEKQEKYRRVYDRN